MGGIDFSVAAPEGLLSETPGVETEAPVETEETPVDTEEVESPEESAEAEEAEPQPTDYRKQTLEYLKSLKAQDGIDPKLIKHIRDTYMRESAYNEIGDINSVRGLKSQLEAIGGPEGLADLQATVASVEETDALLEAGDPQILDQIFEDARDGAIKLAPHYIDRIQKLDPQAFERMMLPHIVNYLKQNNFENAIAYMGRLVGENAEAKKWTDQTLQWFNNIARQSENFRTDTLSPERDQLKQERQTLIQERDKMFMESIQGEVLNHTNTELSKKLQPFQNALKGLSELQRRDIANSVYGEIERAINADRSFNSQLEAMKASKRRDRAGIVRFINTKVSSIADEAVKKIASGYGLKVGGVAPKGTKPQAPSGRGTLQNPILVKEHPGTENIDHDKTTEDMIYKGIYTLKNGRVVKWLRSKTS